MIRRWSPIAVVCALTVALGIGSAVAAQDGEPTELTSEDGLLTLSIPAGAVPDGVDLTIILRQPAEAPEGVDQARARPFYEISPIDVVFAEPVRVKRRIALEAIGVDPTGGDALPVVVTAQHVDGAWRWLDDQRVEYAWGGPAIVLTGTTTVGGQLLPTSSAAVFVAPDEGMTGTVGELFRVEAVLRGPPDSAVAASADGALTHDLSVLAPAEVSDFDFLGTAAQAFEFLCTQAGTSGFTALSMISEMADTNPVAIMAGIGGTEATLAVTGEVICEG